MDEKEQEEFDKICNNLHTSAYETTVFMEIHRLKHLTMSLGSRWRLILQIPKSELEDEHTD